MMMCGNYLPNPANYAYKYFKGRLKHVQNRSRAKKGRDFHIRKSERTRQMQSPKNKAKIMKGDMLTSTAYVRCPFGTMVFVA
jgi:hypothetical protein